MKHQTTIRVEEGLWVRVTDWAGQQRRSVNSSVELLLERGLGVEEGDSGRGVGKSEGEAPGSDAGVPTSPRRKAEPKAPVLSAEVPSVPASQPPAEGFWRPTSRRDGKPWCQHDLPIPVQMCVGCGIWTSEKPPAP